MTPPLPFDGRQATGRRWSLYAGGYLFGWGLVTALALGQILSLLAATLHLPAVLAPLLFAVPVLLVGTAAWWGLVERRRAYSYLGGGAVGLVTALGTGLLWTIAFVVVWGFEMLLAPPVAMLAGFVVGVAVVAGVLVAMPFMYLRRRVAG